MEHTRPFFVMTQRGFAINVELRGTWLARKKPHVMLCPRLVGKDYWVACYRGKTAFDKSPSSAAAKVREKVDAHERSGELFIRHDSP